MTVSKSVCKTIAVAGRTARSDLSQLIAKRSGNARKETCRKTLVVLQHEYVRRETSEFRSHGCLIPVFKRNGNSKIEGFAFGFMKNASSVYRTGTEKSCGSRPVAARAAMV